MTNLRVGRGLAAGLSVVCALLVAAEVVFFLQHASGVIAFPYELAAGEELLLGDAVQVLSGQPVYSDVNQFPFVISNYPPLFALASALLVPLLGVSLTATRLIGSLSTLLCGCLIGLIVYQGTRASVASWLCGGAFLGSTFVYQWGAWGRVDTLGILFSLFALLVVLRWSTWQGAVLGALLCVLALYTKQTEFAAPLAILSWLVWRREGRRALIFGTVLGGVGGLLFVTINSISSGEFFRHLVVYNALPYSPGALLSYWRAFGLTHGIVVGIAMACAMPYVAKRSNRLPTLYLFSSAALTIFVGRAGASSNYFLEPIAASLIVFGLCWGRLSKKAPYGAALLSLGLLGQLLWFRIFPLTPLRSYYQPLPSFGYTPAPADVLSCEQIDQYVEEAEGPILTEGGGFALKNGKELVASPWLLSALSDTGLVNEGLISLETAIEERRFSLIILTWQSYPLRVLNAVWANYERVDTVDCVFTYEVFLPKEEV